MSLPGLWGIAGFSAAAAGGGGETTQYVTWGYPQGTSASSVTANNVLATKITTPAGSDLTFDRVFLGLDSTVTAGRHIRAGLYTDSSGIGTLVAVSDEYTTVALTKDTDVALTFPSPVTPTALTDYWVGIHVDNTIVYVTGTGGVETRTVGDTYSDGTATNPGAGSVSGGQPRIYTNLGMSGTVSGTGLITSAITDTAAASARQAIPDNNAPDDIVFVHVTFKNTSSAPTFVTPDGWTLINEQALNDASNYRSLLYWARIDGTQMLPEVFQSGASPGSMQVAVSVWRGYLASGTPYEAAATSTGTSAAPTGTDITTLGANRTVINTYSWDDDTAFTTNTGAGWSEGYNQATIEGNDCGIALTYKEQATAATVTKETATLAVSERWRSFTLGLIEA